MSESGDWDPGPWQGHDFADARKQYDVHVGRSYGDALDTSKKPEELVPDSLNTLARAPLVVACDVTGSMGESPAVIFSKCPYLDLEAKEYLGEDFAISFAAVGDAYTDKYPIQVRQFAKGLELKDRLKELVIEGGGGGQVMESYELTAMYYATKVTMPNAINPVFVFIGDEGLYDSLNPDQAEKWLHVKPEKRFTCHDIFKALKQKYSVYIIRQPYEKTGTDKTSERDKSIHKQWAEVLGEDHMAFLPDAARVVDVIFGILAKETGKIDYFKNEITQRQTEDQVTVAMKGLSTIHGLLPENTGGDKDAKSVTKKKGSQSRGSKPLI